MAAGFAHGFCTLENCTTTFYKVDRVYSADHERGISWADPSWAIEWLVASEQAVVSEKDRDSRAFRICRFILNRKGSNACARVRTH